MSITVCSLEDCEKPLHGRLYCEMHYRRLLRKGRLGSVEPYRIFDDHVANVLLRVDMSDPGGCWPWTGGVDGGGYGAVGGKPWHDKVHRFVWEASVGPIPEGLHIDHLCLNKRCVNPDHLEPVTQAENNRRRSALITHCPKGHPYDQANTVIDKWSGARRCRICRTVQFAKSSKKWREKNKRP